MGWWENYKPLMALFCLQFGYAGLAISIRSALLQGMSCRIFVVYRQGLATIVIAPIAYFSQRRNKLSSKGRSSSLGLRSFYLIFTAALFGVTINQNIYFEGMFLASSSIGGAMSNLIPALTFVVAAFVGLEKVDKSIRSMAKIAGTVICVVGAVCMALVKGPKLLNSTEFTLNNSLFLNSSLTGGQNWLLGCLLIFGSCCCWAFWLIIQVPMSVSYPDPLGASAWMCFFSFLQSVIITIFLEPKLETWYLHSTFEFACVLYAGIIGSAVSFFIQAWVISQRGPVFSAMFNPLGTVIIMFLGCIILHEELYIGSVIGAIAVVGGLYAVLWGKAKDLPKLQTENTDFSDDNPKEVLEKVLIVDDTKTEEFCQIDLKEPLLNKSSSYVDERKH